MLSVIKSELVKYGENTSIKGIPKILKSKDIFLKGLWFLFFLASTVLLAYLLQRLFTNYYSWPVTTKYGENRKQTMSFPDITVCNLDIFAEGEPEELSMKDYLSFVNSTKNDQFENIIKLSTEYNMEMKYVSDILEELDSLSGYIMNLKKNRPKSVDCPDFIVDCTLFGTDWFEAKEACSVDNFTRVWNIDYYTCYTLKVDNLKLTNFNVMRGISLLLNIGPPNFIQLPFRHSLTSSQARGVQVSVHSAGTPPDLKRGFNVAHGTENIVEIVQTKTLRLDEPYNIMGCTNKEAMPYSNSGNYSSDLCIEYCQQHKISEECGCMTHLLNVPESDNTELCGNFSLGETTTDATKNDTTYDSLSRLICSVNHLDHLIELDESCVNECQLSCSESDYDSYLTSARWPQPSLELDIFKKFLIETDCFKNYPKVRARYDNYLKFSEEYARNQNVEFFDSNLTQIRNSFLLIKFVMKQNFPYYQSEGPVYKWDMMIGTVGGMFSLWLGITVANGVEIIELVYSMLKKCWKNKNSVKVLKENNTSVENFKENQQIDAQDLQISQISTKIN
ncbi:hypothetical protein HELRODRAFT_162034 [Helobdella robusta]|uniref:Uncharacterized protein n=1 Tax=Helobdella robusta TaxID=6412 RepID=T1ES61_HELRO|nr:hypothetical protein HELRODRAFT_162034 [Helobdella robusta]ESN98602.1 hypothetical protein HELRODRAFT_162034 [Helobdella robusta]